MTSLLRSTRLKTTPRLLVLLFLALFTTFLMMLSNEHMAHIHDQDNAKVSINYWGQLQTGQMPYKNIQMFNEEELQDLVHQNQFYLTPSWRRYLSQDLTIEETVFQPSMDVEEKQILYETLQLLQDECESLNITCMMYGGTLLGSWRHHDIIPWDGDADILVNATDKDDIYASLNMYSPAYKVIHTAGRFKLYSKKAKKTSKHPWRWPYVDIWFYNENETHIWDEIPSKAYKREYVYPKNAVFPVHFRPFGKILLHAPRDTFRFLQITYATTDCETYFYNHKTEKTETWRYKSVPCRNFKDSIGFVHRVRHGEYMAEILYRGNHKLHALIINEPTYAIADPFNLTLI